MFHVLLALVMGANASQPGPDPISACYAAANTAHPASFMEVYVDGVPVQTPTSDVEDVFEAVAAAADDASVSIIRDPMGEAALLQAMGCIFDSPALTWSSVRINQEVPGLKVRAHALEYNNAGVTTYLDDVDLAVRSSDTLLQMRVIGSSSCLAMGVELTARANSADFELLPGSPSLNNSDTCTGSPCSHCAFPAGGGCDCVDDEGGTCNHTTTRDSDDVFGWGTNSILTR
ncbi:MAG: hypothetical protein AAFV53_43145 [Myxococcota bacterium]